MEINKNSLDVVIIGHNEADNLAACIESVNKSALILKTKLSINIKIIFVDSYSTDNSKEIALNKSVPVAYPPRMYSTPANCRNTGFFLTNSEYVMFVDGDMQLYPNWLFDGVEFLLKNPEAAGVDGVRDDEIPFGKTTKIIKNHDQVHKEVEKIKYSMEIGGAFLFRRQAILSIGGFEPSLEINEEVVASCQLKSKGFNIFRIDAPMILHVNTKLKSTTKIISRLLFNKKLFTPGSIVRHTFGKFNWTAKYLLYYSHLLVHYFWLVGIFASIYVIISKNIFVGALFLVFLCVVYPLSVGFKKHSFLRGFAAPIIRTVFLCGFIVGYVLKYPKLDFEIKKTDKYLNEIIKLNSGIKL